MTTLDPRLATAFTSQFAEPLPIQTLTWPAWLAGESFFGIAPTGTGKSLAFLLPILSQLDTTRKQTQALVIAPSQELAMQLTRVAREWAKLTDAVVTSVIGSAGRQRQITGLKKNKPHLVIGTLGRVLALCDEKVLKLANVTQLVVDEADAVVSDEHAADIARLWEFLPPTAQVGLFSATAPDSLAELARVFERELPIKQIGGRFPDAITHCWQYADDRAKGRILTQIGRGKQQGLVFFNTVTALTKMQTTLRHANVPAVAIGTLNQHQTQRADALRLFHQGKAKLLLATDVAARGLDIPDLPLVINAQVPSRERTYIHRSGRTGRLGKTGKVLNLGNDHDQRNLKQILGPDIPLAAFDERQSAMSRDSQPAPVTPAAPNPVAPVRAPRPVTSKPSVAPAPIADPKKIKHKKRKDKNKGKPKWANKTKNDR